jgi:hypothetical protein
MWRSNVTAILLPSTRYFSSDATDSLLNKVLLRTEQVANLLAKAETRTLCQAAVKVAEQRQPLQAEVLTSIARELKVRDLDYLPADLFCRVVSCFTSRPLSRDELVPLFMNVRHSILAREAKQFSAEQVADLLFSFARRRYYDAGLLGLLARLTSENHSQYAL